MKRIFLFLKKYCNWDLLDTLRTIMLTLSIMANTIGIKIIWSLRIDIQNRSNNAVIERNKHDQKMNYDDSVIIDMLITIIKGQIVTHDIQTYQLKTIDSLKAKK